MKIVSYPPKTQRKEDMYQFIDAIDKVKFDEEFSDVSDNIKNDCKRLASKSFQMLLLK